MCLVFTESRVTRLWFPPPSNLVDKTGEDGGTASWTYVFNMVGYMYSSTRDHLEPCSILAQTICSPPDPDASSSSPVLELALTPLFSSLLPPYGHLMRLHLCYALGLKGGMCSPPLAPTQLSCALQAAGNAVAVVLPRCRQPMGWQKRTRV